MEQREEVVPQADHQALQHMLSESAWEERTVLDHVAQDVNRHLGGHPDSSLIIDESGCPREAIGGDSAAMVRPVGQDRELPGGSLCRAWPWDGGHLDR